jgi:dTDP-4-amino-4,6-dideoxygalactose transaminase
VLGGKYNMTDIAARIGVGQLRHLESVTRRRRELARLYFSRFDRATGCELPAEDFANSNWHMFQVVLPEAVDRGGFIRAMAERQIGVGVHYPAIHLLELYRKLGHRAGTCPVAERIGRSIATLPLFPRMNDSDVDRVCEATAATIRAMRQGRSA